MNATLVKICSSVQTVKGCDISDPNNPVPIFFHLLYNCEGQPIPTDSTEYPVMDAKFTGDGSGFIRSYFTTLSLQPATGITFSTLCGGSGGASSSPMGLTRTENFLGGRLVLKFGDANSLQLPTVDLVDGELIILWKDTQTPHSGRYSGIPTDYPSNELLITNVGGKDVGNRDQTNDNGFWPFILPMGKTVVPENTTDTFQQLPHDRGDGFEVLPKQINVPGQNTVLVTGLNGEKGLYIGY